MAVLLTQIIILILIGGLAACAAMIWRQKQALASIVTYNYLEDAIESTPMGFLYFDSRDQLRKTNAMARQMLPCLKDGDCPLKTVDAFLDFVFANRYSKRFGNELQSSSYQEHVFTHDFMEAMAYEDRIYLMQASHSQGAALVVFLTDVTDIRMRELRFQQTQKLEALGRLAGGVAHDFNNLISIVDGYSRMIDKCAHDDPEKVVEYSQRIRKAAERGAGLTKQMLLFGQHKMVEPKPIDLAEVLSQLGNLLEPILDKSTILSLDFERGVRVNCSHDAMTQILMNLVINARDALPEGGRIKVTTQTVNQKSLPSHFIGTNKGRNYVCISVSDNGTGISEQVKRRMFEPFFTTKSQGQGAGLGLSMIYGLVKEMSGFIDVETEEGQGTTMRLYLPVCVDKRKNDVTADLDGNETYRFEGYTVMLAEDEPDLRALMKDALVDMGFEVLLAENGNQALVQQDDFQDDIAFLITDVVMPELNGIQLADLFSAIRPDTRIIFLSAFPANGSLSKLEVPEGANLLPKPVDVKRLGQLMHDLLNDNGEVVNTNCGDDESWANSYQG